MYTDILGKKRMKVALHIHTSVSDGAVSVEEALEIYRNAGFDMVALTDHWVWHGESEYKGMKIISGCEYNNRADGYSNDTAHGVFHILGIGCESEPPLDESETDMQHVIDCIRYTDGIVILAHPAWSLNSVEQITSLSGIDATEIYNTVSGVHASNRPYSGAIVDMLANIDYTVPLTAADDTHFYDGDETVSYIMVDVNDGDTSQKAVKAKIRSGEFYATQGPEIHLEKRADGTVVARTSPVSCITFYSNAAYNSERTTRGDALTYAEYPPRHMEKWLRAEAYDAEGRCAWSNIIKL